MTKNLTSHSLSQKLIDKYDRPVPRYTSYPTVPHWGERPPTQEEWLTSVGRRATQSDGISLYIHLPFCEKLCTYCGCNKRITKNHAVEQPYVEAILAEWEIYLAALPRTPRIKELHLGGGTPTFFAPEVLARLIDGIFARAERAEGHSFSFESHPESTRPAHLRVLADRGFDRISIGVQDFNQAILQLINREQSQASIQRTVDGARRFGYRSINFDIIYGLPTQTRIDIIQSVEHIARLKPERIAFYGYAHVPWVSPGQRAYDENDLPRGKEKRALYEMGKMLFQELGYRDIGLDHFAVAEDSLAKAAQTGRLHRNFMGYTDQATDVCIALGCSSIGDSWDTYVQNEKRVEAYQRIVLEERRLPIIKGHRLTTVDQTVRRHILNLMCHQETSWRSPEERVTAVDLARPRWEEMEADGLVRLESDRVRVRPAGMPFLRNICLPLDDYYRTLRSDKPTFSQSV